MSSIYRNSIAGLSVVGLTRLVDVVGNKLSELKNLRLNLSFDQSTALKASDLAFISSCGKIFANFFAGGKGGTMQTIEDLDNYIASIDRKAADWYATNGTVILSNIAVLYGLAPSRKGLPLVGELISAGLSSSDPSAQSAASSLQSVVMSIDSAFPNIVTYLEASSFLGVNVPSGPSGVSPQTGSSSLAFDPYLSTLVASPLETPLMKKALGITNGLDAFSLSPIDQASRVSLLGTPGNGVFNCVNLFDGVSAVNMFGSGDSQEYNVLTVHNAGVANASPLVNNFGISFVFDSNPIGVTNTSFTMTKIVDATITVSMKRLPKLASTARVPGQLIHRGTSAIPSITDDIYPSFSEVVALNVTDFSGTIIGTIRSDSIGNSITIRVSNTTVGRRITFRPAAFVEYPNPANVSPVSACGYTICVDHIVLDQPISLYSEGDIAKRSTYNNILTSRSLSRADIREIIQTIGPLFSRAQQAYNALIQSGQNVSIPQSVRVLLLTEEPTINFTPGANPVGGGGYLFNVCYWITDSKVKLSVKSTVWPTHVEWLHNLYSAAAELGV